MENKIIRPNQIHEITTNLFKKSTNRIVLAGGCFDILHQGHIAFLKASKEQGDVLIVLLEEDKRIKMLKGPSRPIHPQMTRAKKLAPLSFVDYIVLLPEEMTNEKYDELILSIKPAIITSTKGDLNLIHKKRQAQLVNAQVRIVIEPLAGISTTEILSHL